MKTRTLTCFVLCLVTAVDDFQASPLRAIRSDMSDPTRCDSRSTGPTHATDRRRKNCVLELLMRSCKEFEVQTLWEREREKSNLAKSRLVYSVEITSGPRLSSAFLNRISFDRTWKRNLSVDSRKVLAHVCLCLGANHICSTLDANETISFGFEYWKIEPRERLVVCARHSQRGKSHIGWRHHHVLSSTQAAAKLNATFGRLSFKQQSKGEVHLDSESLSLPLHHTEELSNE